MFRTPLNSDFLSAAKAAFDPYVPDSGTEHVAHLLYSLLRMSRPRSVVEYGSGYTTLLMLAALAANESDVQEEQDLLNRKTAAAFAGEAIIVGDSLSSREYADRPRLYTFEKLAAEHEYSKRMTETVSQLGLSQLLVYLPGRAPTPDVLPSEALPIDLAWNDDDRYMEFFDSFWPCLNQNGGLMVFHNVVSVNAHWYQISRMKEMRSRFGDLEVLTIAEPHKLNQSSCAILRRTTDYRPTFEVRNRARVMRDLSEFMRGKSDS